MRCRLREFSKDSLDDIAPAAAARKDARIKIILRSDRASLRLGDDAVTRD